MIKSKELLGRSSIYVAYYVIPLKSIFINMKKETLLSTHLE